MGDVVAFPASKAKPPKPKLENHVFEVTFLMAMGGTSEIDAWQRSRSTLAKMLKGLDVGECQILHQGVVE